METQAPAYGLWSLVILNSAIFIFFAFSFFKPSTRRDWTSFGAFSAFLIALFVEMYGFPLTLFFLSGWLQSRYPGVDWFSHDAGHLLEMMFGWRADPHFGPFHLLSFVLIGVGFLMISASWHALFTAQKKGARDDQAICAYATSPIWRLGHRHVRFPPAVADDPDGGNAPSAGRDVCAARPSGGA